MLTNAIFGLAGVIVTAVVSYFVARRNSSGRVDTSDAKTLWEEADKLRVAYRTEIKDLRIEVTSLRSEVSKLQTELNTLHATAISLRAEAEQWRKAALEKGEADDPRA
jgi:predicted RNase H-like nuclease (RuvC/YqgF family)